MIDELLFEEDDNREENKDSSLELSNDLTTVKWCTVVLRSIKRAFKENRNKVILSDEFQATYPIGAWPILLDQIRKLMETMEDYERCIEIVELKEDVNIKLLTENVSE
jgi:hypothetical protein